jgi:hypothetical protein
MAKIVQRRTPSTNKGKQQAHPAVRGEKPLTKGIVKRQPKSK